jgi:hypothetical protein
MSSELFDSYEILKSLEELAREIISSEKGMAIVEINDEIKREVYKFIRSLLGAIKNFRLYPPYSTIRTTSVKESFEIINDILSNKRVERIDISEVEKSLVINARRIIPKELQGTNIEDFLYIIMDRNIKTASFLRGLQEKELVSFVGYLSADYQEIMQKGSWADLLKRGGAVHIKIDEVKFTSPGALKAGFEDKAKLQDAMLMEFLLGKLDHSAVDKTGIMKTMRADPQKLAKAIMEIAENATAQGQAKDKTQVVNNLLEKMHTQVLMDQPVDNYSDDLAKVMMELEPMLRNKVIRSKLDGSDTKEREIMEGVIASVPDEVIVDVIVEEFQEDPNNILRIKDFINEIITDENKKKAILPKLETKLLALNENKEEVSFIVDKLKWEELPVDKKMNSMITASKDGKFAVGKAKISELLEQLDSLHKREELETSIYQLLSLTKQLDYANRKDLLGALTDFIKVDFASNQQNSYDTINRAEILLKRLKVETDQDIFKVMLGIFKDIINDFVNKFSETRDILVLETPLVRKYSLFINRIFYIFQERLQLKEDYYRTTNDSIKAFILDISRDRFLDILIYSLINSSTGETIDIKEIHQIIGDTFIDSLINLGTEQINRLTDMFKRYVFQTRVIKILSDLGESSMNRLKVIASEASAKEEVNPLLIELIGYLKNENLVDCLLPFLSFKDPSVRRTTILALSEIGSDRIRELLQSIAKNDKDKSIRIFANEQLRKIQGT